MTDAQKKVLRHAWSLRLIVLAVVLQALPTFFSLVSADMFGIDPRVFAVLATLAMVGAGISRLIPQRSVSG